jgi:hypothetical protein
MTEVDVPREDNRELYIRIIANRLRELDPKEAEVLSERIKNKLPSQLTFVKKEGSNKSGYEINPTDTHRAMVAHYESYHKQHGKLPEHKVEDLREVLKDAGYGYPVITRDPTRDIRCIYRVTVQRAEHWDRDVDGTIIYKKKPGKPRLVA